MALSANDIEVSYKARKVYASAENNDAMVFISTQREDSLIAQGLIRDIARNIQQLRKERNYNPNDAPGVAHVCMLE